MTALTPEATTMQHEAAPHGANEQEARQYPHVWVRANLGHSMSYCQHCGGTPNEIAVMVSIGWDMNHCKQHPDLKATGA